MTAEIAVTKERGRIAREIHDGIAQEVYMLGLGLETALELADRDPDAVDEVFMGNVVSAGLGQNIARQCAIHSGLPFSVGASSINKVCGASLKSVMFAAQAIKAGDGRLFVSGGVESMTQAPHFVKGRMNQLRYGDVELRDDDSGCRWRRR